MNQLLQNIHRKLRNINIFYDWTIFSIEKVPGESDRFQIIVTETRKNGDISIRAFRTGSIESLFDVLDSIEDALLYLDRDLLRRKS